MSGTIPSVCRYRPWRLADPVLCRRGAGRLPAGLESERLLSALSPTFPVSYRMIDLRLRGNRPRGGFPHVGVYGSWPFAHSVWVLANCTIMGLGHVHGGDGIPNAHGGGGVSMQCVWVLAICTQCMGLGHLRYHESGSFMLVCMSLCHLHTVYGS